MTLPPYPGPEGSSGDEPQIPETPAEQPPGPTHQPYGEQPPGNPYGQPQQENPYGQPPAPAPYGQQPPSYGYGAYTGANEANPGWSGTAIASFVASLVCCGIPAVILGIIAIFKTGEGKGKGRWMAVTGIALGVVGTIVVAAVFLGGYWIFNNAITPDNAEVGECVELDEDGDTVTMWKQDCDDTHDAEVYAVHEVTEAEAERYPTAGEVSFLCADEAAQITAADGRTVAELIESGDARHYSVFENDDTEAGDHLACLVQGPGGDKLDEKLLD